MNTQTLFSSKTDMWETPQDFFDKLNAEFNFDVDVCATDDNAKCSTYYTKEQDGLSIDWKGVCWCNPPYGKEIGRWVEKAYMSSAGGHWLLCCSLPERIQSGSINTYTVKQNFAL